MLMLLTKVISKKRRDTRGSVPENQYLIRIPQINIFLIFQIKTYTDIAIASTCHSGSVLV